MKTLLTCKKGFVTAGTALMLMFSLPFASSVVMHQRTDDLIYEEIEDLPEKNVALVLGAAAYPSRLSDILKDRMDAAIELHNKEKVTKLILSGAPNEVEGMKKYAIEQGISENDLIEDPEGFNTYSSVDNSSGISEMIIITQAYHLPRAIYIACHFGIDAVGYPSDRRTYADMFEFKAREILASTKAMMDLYF